MKKFFRFTAAALCLAAIVYFLMPLGLGISHIGMYYPCAVLAIATFVLLFPRMVQKLLHSRLRKWLIAAASLLGAGIACIVITLGFIAFAAADAPAEDEDVTVMVLGCQVIGEKPSVMLRDRIETAYEYLVAHPEVKCVATGGKGGSENISEGECIRRELVAMGIDNSRIYVEEQSTSTAENMIFSSEIIRREGLPTTVVVASDNFHQLRAGIYAARNGLDARSLGCPSVWFLGPGYWAREVLALYAAFIRGY
ncbi:MAG: YdcF family protein [Ruminococcaceae bacterium]|nr:YdcF family protein [Oscillospiraceae bacterium]